MPVFRLSSELLFPPPDLAEPDGLLALGGDLSPERLLLAYSMGIFPWYSEGSPILWWSPDPRLVLIPREVRVSRSLRQVIARGTYEVTRDRAFERVIRECAAVHRGRAGDTWITEDMISAYIGLHRAGHAHSVESWFEGALAGGLYGVRTGNAFFGESMFSRRSDASKVALVSLAGEVRHWRDGLIDCQVTTEHLKSLGAREVSRTAFLSMLRKALSHPADSHPRT